jgi:S1-C subfamily serine protease
LDPHFGPWLGLSVDDVTGHLYADPPGSLEVVISRVYADGPARRAGLEVGDIVESFNGATVTSAAMLAGMKNDLSVGQQAIFGIRRRTQHMRVAVITKEPT